MTEEQKQTNTSEVSSASGVLEGLLSNPDLLRRIGGILNTVSAPAPSATGEGTPAEASVQPASAGAAGQTSAQESATWNGDGLASLLSNPAMLEQLPKMISVIKPLLASVPPPKPAPTANSSPQANRDNLLLALKPFLSSERREAVDSIIRLSRLGNVFQQLK